MARINLNLEQYDGEFAELAMERMVEAAELLKQRARINAAPMMGKVSRPPYKKGKYAGKIWTSRGWPSDMDRLWNTIRVTRKKDRGTNVWEGRNVWVMAGNYKAWYAVQVEYGKGGWKGGAHPFLRKAISESKDKMRSIIEGGA